ncbi:MAG: hypothetical protein ACE5IR_28055, partial [bacterium]
ELQSPSAQWTQKRPAAFPRRAWERGEKVGSFDRERALNEDFIVFIFGGLHWYLKQLDAENYQPFFCADFFSLR